MIRVNCPKCGETVEVDESRGVGRNKFRLVCATCNSRFSIKAAPASPVRGDTPGKEDPTLVSMPPGMQEQVQSSVPDPPVGLHGHGDPSVEADTSGLEKQLEARRSVWATESNADVSTTLSFHEDGDGEVGRVDDEAPAAPVRLDRHSGTPVSAADSGHYRDSVSSGGFDEFADGEVALPGDPDEESEDDLSVDLHISADEENHVPAAERVSAEDEDDSVFSGEQEVSDEQPQRNNPDTDKILAVEREAPADTGAMGMSVEMAAPVRTRPAPAPASPPPRVPEPPQSRSQTIVEESLLPPPGPRGRGRGKETSILDEVVVTNLGVVPGYRFEPLGMVTHHFCRPGGGSRDEARKRVRAFGIRYRRGLEALAEQARKLDGNAVLGVEVIIQPTDRTDDPVIWVLVQGTAVRLVRE